MESDMKPLTYKGKRFYYTLNYSCSEYGDSEWTNFYSTELETYTERKYWLFGPKVEKTRYPMLFQILTNIESKGNTKKDIQGYLNRQLSLLDREEEIKNGEIV